MRRRQRGVTFFATLALMTALVGVVTAAALSQRARFESLVGRVEADRARWAAEAALQRALAELAALDPAAPVTLEEDWARLGQDGNELFRLGDAAFRVQIVDANSLLDLNAIGLPQLQRLPLLEEQIESLLDWREGGTLPRPSGAKDEYYNNLPVGYQAALRRFVSVDELLSVRGFTPARLFLPQTDVVSPTFSFVGTPEEQPALYEILTVGTSAPQVAPSGAPKLNVNGAGATIPALVQRGLSPTLAAQIFQRRPFARLGDVVALAGADRQSQRVILDELTVSGQTRVEGKINLNTADEAVLTTVPGLTPDLVSALLTRQLQGYERLSDVLEVPGMTGATLVQTVDAFTVHSAAFLVRAEGRAGSSRVLLQAQVTLDDDGPRIVRLETPPFPDMPTRFWGWPEEPATETDLDGGLR